MPDDEIVQLKLDSGALFEQIVSTFPHPLFVVDEDVRIMACNEAAEAFTGVDPTLMLQRRGGEVMSCLHATETSGGCGGSPSCAHCIIRNSVGQASADRKVYRARARLNLVDAQGSSSERFMLVTASPLVIEDKHLVLLLLEDITEVVRLKSMLPICAGCKKIRDDENYWREVETYLHSHLDVEFSHGLCPDCIKRLYPDFAGGI